MAEKKKTPKIILEREYNIPLRRRFINVPRYKRTKKAVKTLKEFIIKHMKSDNIKIGNYLNLHLWRNGIKNPPHHVLVVAKKNDEGLVSVELKGAPIKEEKEGKKEAAEKKEEGAKGVEKKAEVKKETINVENKEVEVKKEAPKVEKKSEPPKKPKVLVNKGN